MTAQSSTTSTNLRKACKTCKKSARTDHREQSPSGPADEKLSAEIYLGRLLEIQSYQFSKLPSE